jgi:hypothetical protein
VNTAKIEFEADSITFNGEYEFSEDQFSVTDYDLASLNTNVNTDTNFGPILSFFEYIMRLFLDASDSDFEGVVEDEIRNEIAELIDEVNRNSPNLFIRSLIDFPETTQILTLLDQAITSLLQDDVNATLN